jgi:hypothetical protein
LLKILSKQSENFDIFTDFEKINNELTKESDSMVETALFSQLFKNIIALEIAAKRGDEIAFDYIGNKNTKETKTIFVEQLIAQEGMFYIVGKYSSKNKANEGERRTFYVPSMNNISRLSHGKKTQEEVVFDIFGEKSRKNEVELIFTGAILNYTKRERRRSGNYIFLKDIGDGSSAMFKFLYSNKLELKLFIQKWLPYVRFAKETELSKEIINNIKNEISSLEKI